MTGIAGSTLSYIGTNAERLAFATGGLHPGDRWSETDTGSVYKWAGAAWFQTFS